MRIKAEGKLFLKGGHPEAPARQFDIVAVDLDKERFVAVECNKVNSVARKNGKQVGVKFTSNVSVYFLKVEGKERIGETSWNALYKGLEWGVVKEYLYRKEEKTEEKNADSKVMDAIEIVQREWNNGEKSSEDAMQEIKRIMSIHYR